MLHASALALGWKSALLALVETRNGPSSENLLGGGEALPPSSDGGDDEREPFHLDDTELATRLVRDRGLVHYRTPPHAHLIVPSGPVQ